MIEDPPADPGAAENTDSKGDKRRPISNIESPLTDAVFPSDSLEEQRRWMLNEQRNRFEENPNDGQLPYGALTIVAAAVWNNSLEADAFGEVPVPWWAVEAVAKGFRIYSDAIEKGEAVTFGQAMGLGPSGRGSKKSVAQEQKSLRNIRIALRLAKAECDGVKLEAEMQSIADETGMSLASIKSIWGSHSNRARMKSKDIR